MTQTLSIRTKSDQNILLIYCF